MCKVIIEAVCGITMLQAKSCDKSCDTGPPQASDSVVTAAGGVLSPPEEEGVLTVERWVSPLAVDSVEKTSFSSTVTSTPLSPSEPVRGFRVPSSPS